MNTSDKMTDKKVLFDKLGMVHGLALAPMAGFSDRSMRVVAHLHGAEYSVSEMVSARAVCFGDRKTFELARLEEDEGPCAIQIFGSEPEHMARAAEILSTHTAGGVLPVAIDINMGCPVNKIFSNGEGSALMKDPDLIERITSAVKGSVSVPCTVKLRTGIDSEHINAVECALAAEAGGADMITVHGRTRAQMYSGAPDRNVIRAVKEAVHIPVIANGDITDADSALSMLGETGADGIMIGRGAVGNPFIFEEIKARAEGRVYTPPTLSECVECAILQLKIAIEEKGEHRAVSEARKQIALYLHSFRGAAQIRAAINRASTFDEVCRALRLALEDEKND